MNIAEKINKGEVRNLINVDWEKETNYDLNKISEIVWAIEGMAVRTATIDCISAQYRIRANVFGDIDFLQRLDILKNQVTNYRDYDVKTLQQRMV